MSTHTSDWVNRGRSPLQAITTATNNQRWSITPETNRKKQVTRKKSSRNIENWRWDDQNAQGLDFSLKSSHVALYLFCKSIRFLPKDYMTSTQCKIDYIWYSHLISEYSSTMNISLDVCVWRFRFVLRCRLEEGFGILNNRWIHGFSYLSARTNSANLLRLFEWMFSIRVYKRMKSDEIICLFSFVIRSRVYISETVTGQFFLPCLALVSCSAQDTRPVSPVRSCTAKKLCASPCPTGQDRTPCRANRTLDTVMSWTW